MITVTYSKRYEPEPASEDDSDEEPGTNKKEFGNVEASFEFLGESVHVRFKHCLKTIEDRGSNEYPIVSTKNLEDPSGFSIGIDETDWVTRQLCRRAISLDEIMLSEGKC
jgi:hypothetical protein